MLVCYLASALIASADEGILLLKNGGQLRGDIRAVPAADGTAEASFYIVGLAAGTRIKLEARQVRKVLDASPAESKYAQLLPQMPDTAAGHLAMAEWCQKNGLDDLRQYHLEQVLRHAPDHQDARRILGYSLIDGQWARAEDLMEQQGYVRYQGAWRLPQQVAVLERERERELAQKSWRRDLRMWRGWLGGRRDAEAQENFRQIKDPLAAPGLAELLSSERDPRIRAMYIDLLARLGDANAVSALTRAALEDDDPENRLRAIDHLRTTGRTQAMRAFVQMLHHKNNQVVNRAAAALGRLGDPEAVLPLIHALVTRHEALVQPTSNIRPSFGRTTDGGGAMNGLSVGGGPQRVVRNLKNKSVLEALVVLTKQNLQYSMADWQQWYIHQHSSPDANLRRDP
jgi:hypothetical protein